MSIRHPALREMYGKLANHHTVIFLDESYREPVQQSEEEEGYYIIAGSILKKDNLEGTRLQLQEIVGDNYFHTTKALQTANGTKTVQSLLQQCQEWNDNHILVINTQLTPGCNIEHARQQCLRRLIVDLKTDTRAIVFEKRQHSKENNSDEALIKTLRQAKALSDQTRTMWVSPSDEKLLWLPDLVAMAYRRTITHTNETSLLFPQYLQQSTTIIPITYQDNPLENWKAPIGRSTQGAETYTGWGVKSPEEVRSVPTW